jgi:hypothetical protein
MRHVTCHAASRSHKLLRIDHPLHVLAPFSARKLFPTFRASIQGCIPPLLHPLTITSTPDYHEPLLQHHRAVRGHGDGRRRNSAFPDVNARVPIAILHYRQYVTCAANRPPSYSLPNFPVRESGNTPISGSSDVFARVPQQDLTCFSRCIGIDIIITGTVGENFPALTESVHPGGTVGPFRSRHWPKGLALPVLLGENRAFPECRVTPG